MEGRKKWPECEIMGSRARSRDNDQRETARTKWERLFWLRSRAAASGEAPVSKRSAKKFAALSLTHTHTHAHANIHAHDFEHHSPPVGSRCLFFKLAALSDQLWNAGLDRFRLQSFTLS